MDWIKALLFFAALACAACQNTQPADSGKSGGTMTKEAEATDLGPVSEKYTLPGYVVYEEEGRLWVFREGSDALKDYRAKGEPAKRVTLVGAGPNRMTIMGAERETLEAYCAPWKYGCEGFVVIGDDGRLWVFREGSQALADFRAKGEPAKRVTLIGAGPDGKTVMGAERETLEAYLAPIRYGRPGFVVIPDEGRLWIFREGSQALADFRAKGEPAKRVTLIGAGPDRKTIMGADRGTLEAYLQAGNPQ